MNEPITMAQLWQASMGDYGIITSANANQKKSIYYQSGGSPINGGT